MRKLPCHFFLTIPLALTLLLFSLWTILEQLARFMPIIQIFGLLIGLFIVRELILSIRKRNTHQKSWSDGNKKKR